MSAAELYLIAVIVIPLVLVWQDRLRVDVAGLLTAFVLGLGQYFGLGLLGPSNHPEDSVKMLAGLSQPVTITLFSLFVVTRCLDRTGVTRWFARRVLVLGKSSENRLIGLLTANAAFLSLFMNNLAAGALVLPTAIEVSRRSGVRVSKLLIPVAYGSCLGGAATYFTTSNIIASDMLRAANPPQAPLHILDFTPTGGLIAVVGIMFLWFFGARFLPDREASAEQLVARRTGTELERAYQLEERQWEMLVTADSPYANKALVTAGIGARLGLTVLAISRGKQMIFSPSPQEVLHVGDKVILLGREDRVEQLTAEGFLRSAEHEPAHLSSKGAFFSEIVLIPQSKAEGQTLREINFRSKYGMTAVAIRRDGQSYRTDLADMPLRQGDSILAIGGDDRISILRSSADFLLIQTDLSDQPTDWKKARAAICVGLVAIIASIAGVPVYLAMLGAAAIVILARLVSVEDAYRGMEWQAIVLIAGMYPLSTALVQTGLAQRLGALAVDFAAPFGPLGLVAGTFIFTALLTQLMAGQVTTLITAPIFISAAIHMKVNPQAVAVTAAIACSASFLTPLSHPVNSLMIGPGNYRFNDFFRAGWILTLLSFFMLLVGMKLFWGL